MFIVILYVDSGSSFLFALVVGVEHVEHLGVRRDPVIGKSASTVVNPVQNMRTVTTFNHCYPN